MIDQEYAGPTARRDGSADGESIDAPHEPRGVGRERAPFTQKKAAHY
jgi:hypothetical protein